MKTMNIIKTVISYLATLIAGAYALCLIEGEVDFFMVSGCVAVVALAVLTSPLTDRFLKREEKRGR